MQNGSMMREQNDTADQMSGSSGGENLDLTASIAEWSLVQRMSSATRLRLARLLWAFISGSTRGMKE